MKWNLICLDIVESTNDAASLLPVYSCVVAKEQTKARGRCDRSWISLKGNLFFSLVLKNYAEKTPLLSFLISLVVAESLKNFPVMLKWPNDVLIEGKKVAGILLENLGDKVVVGVGINTKFAPEENVLYPTSSLNGLVENEALLREILNKIEIYLDIFENTGFQYIKEKWLSYSKGIGQQILVRLPNKEIKGEFIGLTDEGAVQLQTDDLCHHLIMAGDVFLLNERKKND